MDYRFPKSLGDCLARLAKLQKLQDAITVKLKPLIDEETALRDHLIDSFKKDQLDGARGSGIVLAVRRSVKYNIKDWAKFFKAARVAKNQDLFLRQVSQAAVRERLEAGQEVPGVEGFMKLSLSVTADKKK